jgi:hypothetical protein
MSFLFDVYWVYTSHLFITLKNTMRENTNIHGAIDVLLIFRFTNSIQDLLLLHALWFLTLCVNIIESVWGLKFMHYSIHGNYFICTLINNESKQYVFSWHYNLDVNEFGLFSYWIYLHGKPNPLRIITMIYIILFVIITYRIKKNKRLVFHFYYI